MSEDQKQGGGVEELEPLKKGIEDWGKSVESFAARQAHREKMEAIEIEMTATHKRHLELCIAHLERETTPEACLRRERSNIAALAMEGLLQLWIEAPPPPGRIAREAVEFADALLAELNKTEDEAAPLGRPTQ